MFPATARSPTRASWRAWRATLADPAVTTEVYADPEPVAFTAYDDGRPAAAPGRAPGPLGERTRRARPSRAGGGGDPAAGRTPTLWVLVANHRARGLYEHLGWEPTGREQAAEWPPYPTEIELRTCQNPRMGD